MVITVTLNPAIDKTLIVKDFEINKTNITDKITSSAGGKGINVSKGLKIFGMKSIAITCLGGFQGERLEKLLEEEELKSKIIWLQDESRVNIKIMDSVNEIYTDINEKGPTLTASDVLAIKTLIKEMVGEGDTIVLAGSIPVGVEDSIYKDIINELDMPNVKIVVDTSGNVLKESMSANIWLVKPNIDELREVTQLPLTTDNEIVQVCQNFVNNGVENVLVSLGEEGVIYVSKDYVYKAYSPKVEAKNTVGAGDTVVASFIYSNDKGLDIEETLRYAVASGVAKVIISTGNPTLKSIEKCKKMVVVRKL